MSKFTLHNLNTAPIKSKPLLENAIAGFGTIPNLLAVMAEAPPALEAYQKLHELFLSSELTNDEKTVVWQSINVEHECHYCVPAHSLIAHVMDVSSSLNQALVNKQPLPSERLETLRETTLEIVRNRGRASSSTLQKFFEAGYTKQNLLEIIVGVAQKVMSNYVNHLADTPIDDMFKNYA